MIFATWKSNWQEESTVMNGFLRNIICQTAAGIANDQCWLLLLLLLLLRKLLKLLLLLLLLLLTTVAITITVAITTPTVVYYIATSITSLSARSCSAKPGRDPYLLGNRFKHSKTKSLCCNITLLFDIHPHPFCQRPLVLQHYTTRTEPNRTAMSHEPNRTEPNRHVTRTETNRPADEPNRHYLRFPRTETNLNEPKPSCIKLIAYECCVLV